MADHTRFLVIDGMAGQLLATVDRIGRIGSRPLLYGVRLVLSGVSVLAIPHLLLLWAAVTGGGGEEEKREKRKGEAFHGAYG